MVLVFIDENNLTIPRTREEGVKIVGPLSLSCDRTLLSSVNDPTGVVTKGILVSGGPYFPEPLVGRTGVK